VTIGVAILVSGFVSISLTPMLCSRFLKAQHAQHHGRFYKATERGFDAWLRLYDYTLRGALRFKGLTMAASAVLLAATVYLFMIIPKGFLPTEDLGRFQIQTTAAQGIAYPQMVRHQQQIADIIERDPNVLSAMNILNGGNNGNFQVMLKPRAERKLSVDQVIQQLRPKLAQVPGITAFPNNPPPITIGARGGRA